MIESIGMKEVIPVLKKRTGVFYKRIIMEGLNPDSLRATLLMENCKKPNVVDIGEYLLYGYENHKPIYLSKITGRIYSMKPNKDASIDAFILLCILNKYKMVMDFRRWQHRNNKRFNGWKE